MSWVEDFVGKAMNKKVDVEPPFVHPLVEKGARALAKYYGNTPDVLVYQLPRHSPAMKAGAHQYFTQTMVGPAKPLWHMFRAEAEMVLRAAGHDLDRGTGRSTRQIKNAPKGSIYFLPNASALSYFVDLLSKNDRLDLCLLTGDNVSDVRQALAGLDRYVVVDHYAAEKMSHDITGVIAAHNLRHLAKHAVNATIRDSYKYHRS